MAIETDTYGGAVHSGYATPQIGRDENLEAQKTAFLAVFTLATVIALVTLLTLFTICGTLSPGLAVVGFGLTGLLAYLLVRELIRRFREAGRGDAERSGQVAENRGGPCYGEGLSRVDGDCSYGQISPEVLRRARAQQVPAGGSPVDVGCSELQNPPEVTHQSTQEVPADRSQVEVSGLPGGQPPPAHVHLTEAHELPSAPPTHQVTNGVSEPAKAVPKSVRGHLSIGDVADLRQRLGVRNAVLRVTARDGVNTYEADLVRNEGTASASLPPDEPTSVLLVIGDTTEK